MIALPPLIAAFVANGSVRTAWAIARVAVPILVILGLSTTVYVLILQRDAAIARADGLQVWQDGVVVAVTDATVPPGRDGRRSRVDPATVVTRIDTLAGNLREMLATTARQNAAIIDARAEGERRLEEARRGAQEAAERNAARERVRRDLQEPGRASGLTAAEWSQL